MLAVVPIDIEHRDETSASALANGLIVATSILAYWFAQTPLWFLAPGSALWTTLSYGFAHASVWHLFGNMLALLIVGNPVNRRIGNGYYLTLYLGTLLAMGIAGRLLGLGPLMGSSGAIFAVVAVCLMLLPASRVRLSYAALFPATIPLRLIRPKPDWVRWFIDWGEFRVRAWWCFLLVPAIELWALFWWRLSLGMWQWNQPAHLLGLSCGVLAVLLLPPRITMPRRAGC